MRFKVVLIISVTVLVCSVATSFAADTVLQLIQQGKNAYQQKNYARAHDLLQKAIGRIHDKIGASFAPFLPKAPTGWTGEEPDINSASYTTSSGNTRVTEAERRYIRNSDNEDIEVLITNTPEIIKPYQQITRILQNNTIMKSMADRMMKEHGIIDTAKKGNWYVLVEKKAPKDYKIAALHDKVVVQIDDADSQKTAQKFMGLIDLNGVARTAQ